MAKAITKEKIIDQFIEVHGSNKYDYSMIDYVDTHTKIEIFCNTCEEYFYQMPYSHKKGHGCPICAINKNKKRQVLSKEEVIKQFQDVHGFDKYSYDAVEYKGSKVKVKIYCNVCEKYFYQYPKEHKRGQNCPDCSIIKRTDERKLSAEDVVLRFKEVHGDKYDYSQIDYINVGTPVKIFCKQCDDFFFQRPQDHMRGHGCQICSYCNTFSPEHYGERFKNAQLYILKMYSDTEYFYKIGITSQGIHNRYRKDSLSYEFDVVKAFNMTGYGARLAEIDLLKHHKDFKYTPMRYFEGHTECVYDIDMGLVGSTYLKYKDCNFNKINKESDQFEEYLDVVLQKTINKGN